MAKISAKKRLQAIFFLWKLSLSGKKLLFDSQVSSVLLRLATTLEGNSFSSFFE